MENNNYLVTPDSHQGVPHITPERLATLHRGTIANNDYVLSTGRKFETEIISNNVIRVYDGALIQGGIRGEIEHGDHKDVQISNGVIGMKRHSLIVCRWFVDAEDGRKTHQKIIAVDGIATDKEPIDPEVNTNLIEDGAQVHDTVLYRVVKDGLDIVKVEALFKILMNAEELMEMQKEINSNYNLITEQGMVDLTTNLGSKADILASALQATHFLSAISTGSSSTNVPSDEFRYSAGLVFRRTSEQILIMLFGRNNMIATNFWNGSRWTGWKTR